MALRRGLCLRLVDGVVVDGALRGYEPLPAQTTGFAVVLFDNLDAFRGAEEWRAQHEGAVRTAIEQGVLQGNPEDAPEYLLAAIWCDLALEAEETFWATVHDHADELKESELWDESLRRSRAH